MEQLREQLRTLWASAQTWFSRLTSRERRLVSAAGAAVLAFVLFVVFFSFASSASSTRHRTEEKLRKLQEVQALAVNYGEAEAARQEAVRQLSANNVSLLSFIEEKGTSVGLSIPTMNPKADVPLGDDGKIIETSVELTLTDVSLDKLTAFLSTVERGPGVVKVRSLRLEPHPATQVLTAWATVSTYHLKEGL